MRKATVPWSPRRDQSATGVVADPLHVLKLHGTELGYPGTLRVLMVARSAR